MINAAQLLQPDAFTHSRDARPAGRGVGDLLVDAAFGAANALAAPLAGLDARLRPERTARVRARLFQAHGGHTDGTAELRAIWFARIARECLRVLLALGFTDAVLRRIEVIGASASRGSCVYAIYHTPWGRTLALWMARQSDGVVFSAGRWLDRAGKAHVPCTWRGLRELVRRIRHGAAAAVTADHFGSPRDNHSTTASILGREVQVSTGVARIALAAGVPIVPVLTRYRAGKLQVVIGGEINVDPAAVADATRRMTAAFDAELRRDPSGWEQAHRFLSVAPDERR